MYFFFADVESFRLLCKMVMVYCGTPWCSTACPSLRGCHRVCRRVAAEYTWSHSTHRHQTWQVSGGSYIIHYVRGGYRIQSTWSQRSRRDDPHWLLDKSRIHQHSHVIYSTYTVILRNSILLLVLTIVSACQVSKLKYIGWLASKEPLSIFRYIQS
jgi:hypothetical protein